MRVYNMQCVYIVVCPSKLNSELHAKQQYVRIRCVGVDVVVSCVSSCKVNRRYHCDNYILALSPHARWQ